VPIRQHRTSVDGRDARWLEAGSGWPLVLLHAFPFDADMWCPQLEAVPDGWWFIAPDLEFPADDDGRGLDGCARRVFALLNHLEIEGAIFGGLSLGGYIAFALHRLDPARCTGLVLADTRPQADTAEGRAGREALRKILAEGGPSAVADDMLPRLLSQDADPEVVARVRAMIESQDAARVDAAIQAMARRPDSTPDLPRVSVPVLVVVGAEDRITPPDVAREMQRALPRAYLTVIEHAGHLSQFERPDEFSRALQDFLLAHI
jgi:pimeloyl-ACP methyl ester carboxylesterase